MSGRRLEGLFVYTKQFNVEDQRRTGRDLADAAKSVSQVGGNEQSSLFADHHFLQPMDGDALKENTNAATKYCLTHPAWRLSLQTHKMIGIP